MKNLVHKLILTMGLLIPLSAFGYDFESNGIYYNVLSGKDEVEVTYDVLEHATYSGVIQIPTTVQNGAKTYKVTAIGDKAFYNSTITTIHIPEGITTIGNYAFYFSAKLVNLTLPQSLKTLSTYCFSGTNILSIAIPEGITSIPTGAFQTCESLHSVFLPSTITSIGSYGFYANHQLREIYVKASKVPNATAFAAFQGITTMDIIVPEGSDNAYLSTDPWKNFSIYLPEEFSLTMTIHGTRTNGYDIVELDDEKAFKIYDGEKLLAITSSPTYMVPNTEDKTFKFVPTDYFYEAAPLYYTVKTGGVSEVQKNDAQIYLVGKVLIIKGNIDDSQLEIFNLEGEKLYCDVPSSQINLDSLSSGVYIVKYKTSTKKILL